MKKLLLVFTLLLGMGISASQVMAAERLGVYVAPKLAWTFVDMGKVQGESWISGTVNQSDNDSVFAYGIGIGYDFRPRLNVPLRTELEYFFLSEVNGQANDLWSDGAEYDNSYSKHDLNIQTLFLNAYYDFNTGTPFTPYVGAGLGVAFIQDQMRYTNNWGDLGYDNSYSDKSSSKRRTNFAWNIGAGIGWEALDWLTLDLGYRFSSLGKAETGTAFFWYGEQKYKVKNIKTHQVMLGLRLTF